MGRFPVKLKTSFRFEKDLDLIENRGSHPSLERAWAEYVDILSRFHAHRTDLKRVESFVSRKFLWKL